MRGSRLRQATLLSLLAAGCASTPSYSPAKLNTPATYHAVAPAANAQPRGQPAQAASMTTTGATATTATAAAYWEPQEPGSAGTPAATTREKEHWGDGVMGRPGDTGFDSVGTIATALTVAILVPLAFSDDESTREAAGDTLQILLPLSALAGTLVERDREGAIQFSKSFITAWTTTYILKTTIEKWRPSGSNTQSFPSGHTMGAFSGASFIQARYGSRFGIPAYIAAVFTGVSRVDSENHFMDDVVAGASISMLSTWFFTTPHPSTTSIEPVFTETGGVGLGIKISNETEHTVFDRHHQSEDEFRKRFRFEWAFGAAYQSVNTVTTPIGTGDEIAFHDFTDVADSTTTSQLYLEYYPAERHELNFRFSPYEVRDSGTLSQDSNFNGTTFPADQTISSSFQYYDTRFWYRYDLLHESNWTAKLGVALAIVDTRFQLADDTRNEVVEETVVMPALHTHLGYRFARRWRLFLESDIGAFQGDNLLDGNAMLRYEMNRQWDVGLGYRFVYREVDTDQIQHELEQHRMLLAVGHTF